MNTSEKAELTTSICRYYLNTNLQLPSPGHNWQKNKKENTGKCKLLCVLYKPKDSFFKNASNCYFNSST